MKAMKTDKEGYNNLYKDTVSSLISSTSKDDYIERFKKTGLSPFCKGGNTKGYVRGLAVDVLMREVERRGLSPKDIHILDTGCGQGELSVYLATKGFTVIGVDISVEACRSAERLADVIGVKGNCRFLPEGLENIPLADQSVDFVIGHAALHHFIKYEGVANELGRILKDGGEMFFADAFGENKTYHMFHNRERMQRLGDVILTRRLIYDFFSGFKIELVPTDWFVMIDKLLLGILPQTMMPGIRVLSNVWWHLDRLIRVNRVTLYLSGAVITHVIKRS